MDIAALRLAVAAAANAIPGVVAVHYTPDSGDPPFIYPADVSWVRDTVDDAWSAILTVRVLTSRSEDRAGQENLDRILPLLTAALEAMDDYDVSLNSGTGYDLLTVGGGTYFGAELDYEVLA